MTPLARARQRGMMLLEVLVAILIFSMGILAMLGMQATGMRATIDAKYRSEASFLATEIIGAIWGDAGNVTLYDSATCSGVPACNAWLLKVANRLPNATGANVPTIDVAGRQVTVTVRWQRPGETTASRHELVAYVYRATD
jgi:type IV pilus assembly protein PilV